MSRLSLWSEDSVLSIGSKGSVLSVGSVGSVQALGSMGSAASGLSVPSAASVGLAFSCASRWSLISFLGNRSALDRPAHRWVAAGGGILVLVGSLLLAEGLRHGSEA